MRKWCESYGAKLALFGAIMATLGDCTQLWVVNAGRPDLNLTPPPPGLIVWGTLIGILGIPVQSACSDVADHGIRIPDCVAMV